MRADGAGSGAGGGERTARRCGEAAERYGLRDHLPCTGAAGCCVDGRAA